MTLAAIEDNLVSLSSTAINISSNVKILVAVRFLARRWRLMKMETIANCFCKGGFQVCSEYQPMEEPKDQPALPEVINSDSYSTFHKKVNRSVVKGSYSTLQVLSKYGQATVEARSLYYRTMVHVWSSYCQGTAMVWLSYRRGTVLVPSSYRPSTVLVLSNYGPSNSINSINCTFALLSMQ